MAKVYDDLILMFTRRMYSLKNNAKATLEVYHEKSRHLVSSLIEQLAQIGTAYQIENSVKILCYCLTPFQKLLYLKPLASLLLDLEYTYNDNHHLYLT